MRQLAWSLLIVFLVPLAGCESDEPSTNTPAVAGPAPTTRTTDAYVVDVVARDFRFEAPASIASGWVTFRVRNDGQMPHFIFLQRLPDAITFSQYVEEVPPVFGVAYEVRKGKLSYDDALAKLVAEMPAWFWTDVKQMGGNGIASGGVVTETTLKLEPGRYTMECYIKTDEGIFHTDLGMIRELVVTEETSGAAEPAADIRIGLRNFQFDIDGVPTRGEQLVAATFEEHPEAGLGNDIHLVRLDADTDLNEVIAWMDWLAVDGLRTPAPARFLGGTHEMPVGHTAYFKVDLTPGRYAWIAESAASQGMVQEFTIR